MSVHHALGPINARDAKTQKIGMTKPTTVAPIAKRLTLEVPPRVAFDTRSQHKDVASFEGLSYMQAGALARLAQRAKGAGDWDTYRRVMSVADGVRGPTAWALLSPELQDGWRAMRAYNERLTQYDGKPTGRQSVQWTRAGKLHCAGSYSFASEA